MFFYPYTLRGKAHGKNLVILAAVHGNETAGIAAFERILPTLTIDRGTVTFDIGNPKAYGAGVRFIDTNLNRMFLPDSEIKKVLYGSYEFERSRELIPLLKSADALLDLHGSNTPDSQPFIICEPHSYPIVSDFPVETVSSGWDLLEPGGTDYFVNKNGGYGICVECGYVKDVAAEEVAYTAILRFLEKMGATDSSVTVPPYPTQRIVSVYAIHHTKTDFKPARIFKDFQKVTKGEIIGTDGDENIIAQEDSSVVFVRERNGPHEEAFLFAKEKPHV